MHIQDKPSMHIDTTLNRFITVFNLVSQTNKIWHMNKLSSIHSQSYIQMCMFCVFYHTKKKDADITFSNGI